MWSYCDSVYGAYSKIESAESARSVTILVTVLAGSARSVMILMKVLAKSARSATSEGID